MLWIDTIMFNGEEIINLRLNYLYPHVARFYICEQRYTHQGVKKGQLFIEKMKPVFEPYLDKIKFIIDERDFSKMNTWQIENIQRNYPVPTILDDLRGQKYICSICDCDEIPNVDAVLEKTDLYELCNNGAVYMEQDLYYYNLNWYQGKWNRAFFLNDATLRKYTNVQIFREKYGGLMSGMFSCGWHFSYFMPTSEMKRKIESFAHKEFNDDKFKNEDHMRNCILHGHDMYKRDWLNCIRNTNFNFPESVLNFNTYIQSQQTI
jgi:hypothetical protein